MREVDVAVVGGGAAGTLLVLQLMRRAPALRVALIDGRGAFARGVAYSTPDPSHLLNVQAGGMSADPDQPSAFARWLRDLGHPWGPDDFAPRRLYGEYLEGLLDEAQRAQGHRLALIRADVTALRPLERGGAALTLETGTPLQMRAVVLATGNAAPARLRVPDDGLQQSAGWLRSPWAWERVAAIPREADVFLLGTGLTAVDVVLTLRRLGHAGRIHALSRHGRLPLPHAEVRAEPLALAPPPDLENAPQLRPLFARVRAAAKGQDWRAVVDGLRPLTTPLWQAFSDEDRRRFLRHLRSLWDIHRHRMAPAVARELSTAREEGHLVLHGGRLDRFTRGGPDEKWQAHWRHHGEPEQVSFDVGVNCTGPAAPGGEDDPLGRALFEEGLAQKDPLRLGLLTSGGALLDASGNRSPWLFALGPLLRGERWETTAIPELRVQAQALSEELVRALAPEGQAGIAAQDHAATW